jgi:stress-induced morphogen
MLHFAQELENGAASSYKEPIMKPEEIKKRLETAYPDGRVTVTDLTGTNDHYQVFVSSKTFTGLSRIQCHKHVMNVFADELQSGEVHALTIKTETI